MNKNIKGYLPLVIISAVFIVMGIIFPSVVTRAIGYVWLLILIISLLYSDLDEKKHERISVCLLLIIIALFGSTFYLAHIGMKYRDLYYISESGKRQHLYYDCSALSHSKVREVKEAEAKILGKYKVCKVCLERRYNEIDAAYRKQVQQTRKEMLDSLYVYIKFLKRGGHPDVILDRIVEGFGNEIECSECGAYYGKGHVVDW